VELTALSSRSRGAIATFCFRSSTARLLRGGENVIFILQISIRCSFQQWKNF